DVHDLADVAAEAGAPLTLGVGGGEAIGAAFGETIEGDLARAESIAVPITLVLLVLVFGGLLAGALPLFVGMIATLGTFLSLYVIGSLTDVSIFAINLTTALGLGLAIDYSLFIVSRYREELHAGRNVEGAVVRAVETAGRTIAIGALTVAVSLSALLVFPQYFLRSFAYAGIAVVLTAMVASLVSLPALLSVVGTRIDSLRILRRRHQHREEQGFWYRTATQVMRRPITVAVAAVAVLLLLGSPFLGVKFGSPDARMLPESDPARITSEALQRDFAGDASESFPIVVEDIDGEPRAVLTDLASGVSDLDGVDRVETATGTFAGGASVAPSGPESARYVDGDAGWLSVVPSVEMGSDAGESMVGAVRDLDVDAETLVGGQTAELIDSRNSIASRLPLALGIIAVTTTVLLFLLSGSLLVPLKAMVLNLLSLTATFGAMVWIFQDGNLSGLLDFTATGAIDTTTPILMFCIAFGLSMDYEVFLLSRIKEEHDRTGDNDHAVALGLERTGRIVTAAAVLLSVTFFAFGTSGVSFIKMFGIGLAIAVLMDAFVIRGLLVPAFMKLAGNANWWAPGPLRRLHDRIGIIESEPLAAADGEAGVE
ncbi:MAG: MMPL family transporter, partial [Acidimicrobiia bacterium]|nr:MMPL family transporter [Acidimicrobiia bacterium]